MESIHKELDVYSLFYTDIVNTIEHKKYYYMDTGSYMQSMINEIISGKINESMQIYWKEMLLRVNFVSVTSVLRNQKWLDGVIYGIKNKNLMVFAASLRGFLEAVTDSYYSLSSVPTSLAINFKNIDKAIKGELSNAFMSRELEETLIHFEFASKANKILVDYNKPLTVRKYIENFDMYSELKTKELYSELCEITHPASKSVSCFTSKSVLSEHFEYKATSDDLDNNIVKNILIKYKDVISNLLKISLGLPAICLKTLNLYNFNDVKSHYIDKCKYNNTINREGWENILRMKEQGSDYLNN